MKLERCGSCGGFARAAVCPHCGKARSALGAVGVTALGGAIAFTLMACYGGPPPCPDGTYHCREVSPPATGDAGEPATPEKAP